MKKIGILYICTGDYWKFWPDFFSSCEECFLPKTEKKYFVFTDNKLLLQTDNPKILPIYTEKQPWPYPTLLRYKLFDANRELFSEVDYLVFCNSNLLFEQQVHMDEVFNDKSMFATLHPGYYRRKVSSLPFETNPKSKAFFKPQFDSIYVCGGFNGGKMNEFMKMSKFLAERISEDEEKDIIAQWHDESHFNKFVNENRAQFNVLSPEFCWPEFWLEPAPIRILIRDKRRHLNLKERGFIYNLKFAFTITRYYTCKIMKKLLSIIKKGQGNGK
jgi:hypothetical protein